MPAIRFPASAVPLLPLCKGHGDFSIFPYYADLIGFVAAYGFHLFESEGQRFASQSTFVDKPNAIGLEVFENRGLYANLLMIALAHDKTRTIAQDEELLVKLIEKFAYLGARELCDRLPRTAHGSLPERRSLLLTLSGVLESIQSENNIKI